MNMEISETLTTSLGRPDKPTTMEIIDDPSALTWDRVLPRLQEQAASGRTIVATNGHFVMFHPGHSAELELVRAVGAGSRSDHNDDGVVLLVVVNSDAQTKAKDPVKGAAQPAVQRAQTVHDNRHVDYVVISEAPQGDSSVITDFQKLADSGLIGPGFVYVKGGDYDMGENIPPEAQLVQERGGSFALVDRVGGFSTSSQVLRMLEVVRQTSS